MGTWNEKNPIKLNIDVTKTYFSIKYTYFIQISWSVIKLSQFFDYYRKCGGIYGIGDANPHKIVKKMDNVGKKRVTKSMR